ncbi:uncharacterized protein LOC144160131 [Haemaphysalis longicornis]
MALKLLLDLKTISWLLLHLSAISWLLLSTKTVKLHPLVQDASRLQQRGTHPLLPWPTQTFPAASGMQHPLQWPTQTFQAAPGMALKLLLHLKTISWQLLHLKTISWLLLHLNAISWLLLSIKTMSAACIALSACFTGRLETLNSTLLFHTQVKLRPLVQDASLLQ